MLLSDIEGDDSSDRSGRVELIGEQRGRVPMLVSKNVEVTAGSHRTGAVTPRVASTTTLPTSQPLRERNGTCLARAAENRRARKVPGATVEPRAAKTGTFESDSTPKPITVLRLATTSDSIVRAVASASVLAGSRSKKSA